MGNTTGFTRGSLLLALMLSMSAISACVAGDTKGKTFDIPAQPAASALNEFAKQADVTLIFSYDLVAGVRTRPLNGNFTVSDGLAGLLDGTPLGYRRSVDGTYLICPLAACGPPPSPAPKGPDLAGWKGSARWDSGNSVQARLQDKPVAVPGT
jgi:iron complex outermembrane receptor protein